MIAAFYVDDPRTEPEPTPDGYCDLCGGWPCICDQSTDELLDRIEDCK